MNALILFFACVALTTAQQATAPLAPAQVTVSEQPVAAAVAQPASRSYGGYGFVAQPPYPSGVVAVAPVYPQTQVNYVSQPQQVQVLSAVDASRQLIAAAVAQGANANNFGIQTNAHYTIAQAPNPQVPAVLDALDALRGRAQLTIDEILNILSSAVAGRDYPLYNDIPSTRFTCENVKQAGFYADTEAQCQVIRRCDINGVLWSYLCPNMTLFNQITLVCDWFFNVNCQYATQYYDYSNPRLYTQFALLDTPASNIVLNAVRPTAAYAAPYAAPANAAGYSGAANVVAYRA